MTKSQANIDQWKSRITLPNYRIQDAARYSEISAQTVSKWLKNESEREFLLRKDPKGISYLELIEISVVAAFRKAGVSLARIERAHKFMSEKFNSQNPFAQYQFKTDGKSLFIDCEQVDGNNGKEKLIRLDHNGQLEWERILPRLQEFEYEDKKNGIVVRWYPNGRSCPVIIDPRISFGMPNVHGTPTWIIKDRRLAGESPQEIADDYDLEIDDIEKALRFEGVNLEKKTVPV